jgi:hypothetical protein
LLLWLGWRQPGLSPDTRDTLTSLDPEQLHSIRLTRRNRADIKLSRQANDWQLVEPAVLPVAEPQLRDLLKIPQARSFADYPADAVDLAPLGLSPPSIRLWLNDVEIQFGNRAPVEGHRYVLVEQVLKLISNVHYDTVIVELATFVSPRLLPSGWNLNGIELPTLTLTRNQDNSWQASGERPLSAAAAEQLAQRWQTATAAAVQKWVPGLVTLGNVVLNTTQQARLRIEQLANAPDFILSRPALGLRYHFSPRQGELLMGEPTSATNASGSAERR